MELGGETYRLLFEASPRPMWLYEPESRRLLAVNDAAVAMYGWSRDELLAMTLTDLRPPSEHAALAAGFAAGEKARSFSRVGKHWTKAGEIMEVHVEVSCIAVAGKNLGLATATKVTAMDQAEARFRRSEASFRTLIERAPLAILVHRDGVILYVNPAAAAMFGYDDAAALVGRPVVDQMHPDDRDYLRQRLLDAQTSGSAPPGEARMLRRDGSSFVVEAEALILELDSGTVNVVFARDVTERRELFTRMSLADRMLTVGTLAAGVAHEINNPLSYVATNLELLAAEMPQLIDNEPTQVPRADLPALLGDARDGVARVTAIVRDLRALARPAEDRPRPIDVAAVLASSIKMAHNEVRHRARVVESYARGMPAVLGNASRLGQVFLNLLLNAAQAMPDGRAGENEIRVRARADGDQVIVEIEDTGTGIPASIIRRIFDPFFTTKAPGTGMGLGLAISHQIVRAMDGHIAVASEPGHGTTFTVTLPAAPAVSRVNTPLLVTRIDEALRVLVIDDEPAVGRALCAMLSRGHHATAVTSARDALSRLDAGEPFDVILCDLMMPEVSGIELYALLPAVCRERVIFMTGGAFTAQSREFLARTDRPRLDKPFTERELREAIGRVKSIRDTRSDRTPGQA